MIFGSDQTSAYAPLQAAFDQGVSIILERVQKQEQEQALHVKWASMQVYVIKPWKPDIAPFEYQAKLTLIDDTLIPAAVVGRAWAHVGWDESVVLENGDDGATYISADRLHPNPAGYAVTAAQHKAMVGL